MNLYEVIITYHGMTTQFAYRSNGSPVQYLMAETPKEAQAKALDNAGLSIKDGVICYVRQFRDEGS